MGRLIETRVVSPRLCQKELGATEVIDLKHVYVCSGIRILAPDVRPLSLTADGNSAVLVSGYGICDHPFEVSRNLAPQISPMENCHLS